MNQTETELFNQHLEDNYLEWYDTDQDGMDSMWYDQYLKFQRLSKLWDWDEVLYSYSIDGNGYEDEVFIMYYNYDLWSCRRISEYHKPEVFDDEAWEGQYYQYNEPDYEWEKHISAHDTEVSNGNEELMLISLEFENISEINK